ncbi:cell wall-binding repeat-containing protein [Peptostreptococcus canis]|uniref:Cell wall-binding repeat-containing protein n=1 Tax=Peptostreptococcus canis TaxID=1159213 RepID=A0ABR6TKQ9_9FIRM|nr:cell wall-binding repeat-containing protein [Peptostreptococcus canis]MBC2575986.1 cell wall-binding repeat-containing protein [Peptostreptococcus canis]MBP1997890.1 putative cell wall-binding protein [Peptostreptococcus canis]
MKKYLKYILIAILLFIGYKVADKILDKLYLNQYTINDYTDSTRYSTVNKVLDARFKKSETAILINTDNIDQIVCVAPYAYSENIPVFYTEKNKIMDPVYNQLSKLGVKKVIIIGGVDSLTNSVERSLVRNSYIVERIIESRGINTSIKFAELLAQKKKVDTIAVVSNNGFDLPNAVSFSPIAQSENIPIIVTNKSRKDYLRIKKFIDKYNIKNAYLVGNDNMVDNSISHFLPNVKVISGEDRYFVNTNIIESFYKNDNGKKVFISKGGELVHRRFLAPGQLINAMAISPLAADNKAPLFLIEKNYFNDEESKLIKKNGYKELNQVGFKIERRNILNIERLKTITTFALVVISLAFIYRMESSNKKRKV